MQFHVARSFELLEDDFVHFRAGIDERRGDNGEGSAAFDVAGGTKEAFGLLQCVGIHTTGEDLARCGGSGVEGARQTGDGVEENDDIVTAFDHAFGFVEHHLGDADVARCGFVEGRGDNFGIDRACHVGNFFGTLVDEEHHEIGVGIVGGNGVGDLLHQNRLTRFGLRDDEGALSLADGRKQVDDAAGQRCVATVREFELFVGK